MKKLLSKLLIFSFVFGFISFIISAPVHAAASLYLAPASSTVNQESYLSVAIRVNTGGDKVNAVQANLSYPADKLDYISTSSSGSAFDVEAESSGGGGSVKIARGKVGTVTGDQLVATITFKAKLSSGSAIISFTAGSAVVRSSDSKDILSGKSGGTYNFKAAPPPPKPDKTAPKISGVKVVKVGLDTAIITWKTNEKSTSLVEYGPTKKLGIAASNTKLKTTHEIKLSSKILLPGTQFYYMVKSKDAAGNEAKSKMTSFKTKGYLIQIKVLDLDGEPLVGAKVTLLPGLEVDTTNKSGIVIFKNIALGTHGVQIEIEGQKLSDIIEVKETKKPSAAQKFEVKVAVVKAGLEGAVVYVVMLVVGLITVFLAAGLFWMRRKKLLGGTKDGRNDSFAGKDIHFMKPKNLSSPTKGGSVSLPKADVSEQPSKPSVPQEPKPIMPKNKPKI